MKSEHLDGSLGKGGLGLKRFIRIAAALLAAELVFLTLFFAQANWELHHPELTEVEITCPDLPASFDGFRILQISDLHAYYLEDDAFWEEAMATSPDLIAITGDVVSRGATEEDLSGVQALLEKLSLVAPVYYVGGNHEAQKGLLWEETAEAVAAGGGIKLSDETLTLIRGKERITLMGLRDPFRRDHPDLVKISYRDQTLATLRELSAETEEFTLLLAHRPEDVDLYAEVGIDLALTGHTHGGQVRLPLIGAVFAPTQGVFPAYSAGLYEVGETQMYLSRGLGGFPRFLCRPELPVIELHCA